MREGLRSIALWSPKGGVGKSVLAVAMALKLAERERVVLVDGNPDNPDVVSLLQCPGQPNVAGWVEPADAEQFETLLVRHSNRLWVLPGPPRYTEGDTFDGPVMESILRTCAAAHLNVVIDLGTSLRNSTVVALDQVDHVFIPVTLDLLSLAPLKRLSRELDLWRLPKSKFSVIINRHTTTREITVDDVRSLSEFPVSGVVPSSRELAAAINQGEVGVGLTGNSAVGRAVAAIVEPMFSALPDEQAQTAPRKGLLGGLFGGPRARGERS